MVKTLVSIFSRNMDDTLASLILLGKKLYGNVVVIDDHSKDDSKIIAEMAGADFIESGPGLDYAGFITKSIVMGNRLRIEGLILLPGHFPFGSKDLKRFHEKIKSRKNDMILSKRTLSEELSAGLEFDDNLYQWNGIPEMIYLNGIAMKNTIIPGEGDDYLFTFRDDFKRKVKVEIF